MHSTDAIATYQRWIRCSTATIEEMTELAESLQRRGCEGSATMLQHRILAAQGQREVWEKALANAERGAA